MTSKDWIVIKINKEGLIRLITDLFQLLLIIALIAGIIAIGYYWGETNGYSEGYFKGYQEGLEFGFDDGWYVGHGEGYELCEFDFENKIGLGKYIVNESYEEPLFYNKIFLREFN